MGLEIYNGRRRRNMTQTACLWVHSDTPHTRNFLSPFPYAEATDLSLGRKSVELDSAVSQKKPIDFYILESCSYTFLCLPYRLSHFGQGDFNSPFPICMPAVCFSCSLHWWDILLQSSVGAGDNQPYLWSLGKDPLTRVEVTLCFVYVFFVKLRRDEWNSRIFSVGFI